MSNSKRYCIDLDERVAEQLEEVARDIAKITPEALIVLFLCKALAPWHIVNLQPGGRPEFGNGLYDT